MPRFDLQLHPDVENGGYVVDAPGFSDRFAGGETIEEAIEDARDTIRLYLEDRAGDGPSTQQAACAVSDSDEAGATATSHDAGNSAPADVSREWVEANPRSLRDRLTGIRVRPIQKEFLASFPGPRFSTMLPAGDERLLCSSPKCCGELAVLHVLSHEKTPACGEIDFRRPTPWGSVTLSLPLAASERHADDGFAFDPPWFQQSDRAIRRSRQGGFPALRRQREAEYVAEMHHTLWRRHRAAVIVCPNCDTPHLVNRETVNQAIEMAQEQWHALVEKGLALEGHRRDAWKAKYFKNVMSAITRTLAVKGYHVTFAPESRADPPKV